MFKNLLATVKVPVRLLPVLIVVALMPAVDGQTMKAPDVTRVSTLYVVPYAHLDTQWRWEFPQTISEYLLKTLRVNFDYIDRYPHYVFNRLTGLAIL
jgi:alpha-mannosidase